jgi:hypothetical protein
MGVPGSGCVCENAGEWEVRAECETPRCHPRGYEEEQGNVAAFVKTRVSGKSGRSARPRAVTSAATERPRDVTRAAKGNRAATGKLPLGDCAV